MFPNESGLQSCSPTPLFSRFQVPPAALQLVTPSSSDVASTLQETLATLDNSRPAIEATPGRATAARNGVHASPTRSLATPHPTSTQSNSGAGGASEATFLGTDGLSESPSFVSQGTVDAHGATTKTGLKVKSEAKSLSPASSAIATSSTVHILASARSRHITSDRTTPVNQAVPESSIEEERRSSRSGSMIALATHSTHSLSIETLSSDSYLIDGHTLVWNSTLTFGSGTVVTRVALGTDKAGHTFLLGDSITKAPGTSCVGPCSEIRAFIQSTSVDQTSPAKIQSGSGGLPIANAASSVYRVAWIPLATICLGWTAMYCVG